MRYPLIPRDEISALDRLKTDVRVMLEHKDWSHASQAHLVLLHCLCHQSVYGVPTAEERGKDFTIAKVHCGRILRTQFEFSTPRMVEYIQWFWSRERGREKWRRDNKSESTFRADWRIVFSDRSVVDYRLEMARQAEKL